MSLPTEQDRIESIGEQLRAKITSKFTASTFLAGFALAVLTGQVFALWQSEFLPLLFPASVGAIFGALILFVEAIIRLDELTMPKRFWSEDPGASSSAPIRGGYLTDDDLWELQKRMIFFWQHLTITATAVTATAVMAMLLAVFPQASSTARRWTFLCTAVVAVAVGAYCRFLRVKVAKTFSPLVRPVD